MILPSTLPVMNNKEFLGWAQFQVLTENEAPRLSWCTHWYKCASHVNMQGNVDKVQILQDLKLEGTGRRAAGC